MSNAMSFKAKIRNFAASHNTTAQTALQLYVMEAFVRRLASSAHKDRMVLKGGFVLSHLTGVTVRTTMDIDGTVRRMRLDRDAIRTVFEEICSTAAAAADEVRFSVLNVDAIRADSFYHGLRVSLKAEMWAMTIPLKFDVTAGDAITPSPVSVALPMTFGEDTVTVLAYNVETMLSEKLYAVLSLGLANTRMRDFYDVAILTRHCNPDYAMLRTALQKTAAQRDGEHFIDEHKERIEEIAADPLLQSRWESYRRSYGYVGEMTFDDAVSAVSQAIERMGWQHPL